MPVDTKAATDRLMRFLSVEGVTGKEAAIGRELGAALEESGVPAAAIRLDDANTRIPVPTETGNLIVDLPGRGAMHNQPRIMFMTHMDTVPLCAGAKPKLAGRKIVNGAKTALGIFRREIDISMAQMGATKIADLGPQFLMWKDEEDLRRNRR